MNHSTRQFSDVVGIGSVVVDEQMFLDRIPAEDEKEKAIELRRQIGGPVPTALAMLRRFQKQCHFIGSWGDDLHGAAIEQDLNSEGITYSDSCRMPGYRSGVAHVWTSTANGSRTIAAMQCSWDNFALSDEDMTQIQRCSVLHLDGTGGDIAVQAATDVHNRGGCVFVDAGAPKQATPDLIPLASVFSFPERFASQFFDTEDIVLAGKKILQQGASVVVCTRGDRGAIVFDGGCVTEVPAFSIEVADSTGAGDVFCGGVIAGLLDGQPVAKAVRTGSAAAALKCRCVGNRAALPTPHYIQNFISDGL